MRLLLVVHAFPPRSNAGVEVYTLRVARALLTLGHEVRVLTAAHDLGAAPFSVRERVHEGVHVTEINNVYDRGTLRATWDLLEIERAGASLFAAFRPDAVHFQHLLNLSSGLVAEARRAGARTFLTLHDYWLSCPRDGLRMRADLELCRTMDHSVCARCLADSPYLVPPAQRHASGALRAAGLGGVLHRIHDASPGLAEAALDLMRKLSPADAGLAVAMDERAAGLRGALQHLDGLFAPTSFARRKAIEFGAPEARTIRLPYGAVVDAARPRAARARRRFGYVGTLAPHKGVHVLVQAFRRLERDGCALEIYGQPDVFPSYSAQLRELAAGDARIRFHGGFPEGGQKAAHASFDALVVPSLWWENSPLSALEALGAGLPVVASRTGGVSEIVPESDNLLVPPGNVDVLYAALDEMAAGRVLAGPLAALPLKTVAEGARELADLYSAGLP